MSLVYQCNFCDEYVKYENIAWLVKIRGTNRKNKTATIYSGIKKNSCLSILLTDGEHICKNCVSNLTWEVTCD